VIAVAGGLGAAVCWAIATIVSSRSSRMIGASSVLGWVMLVGVLVALGPALAVRPDGVLDPAAAVLSIVSGLAYVGALYLNYRALRIGPIGIVAPITSAEGAIAALIAVVLGEPLELAAAIMLALIVVGVVLASTAPGIAAIGPAVRLSSSGSSAHHPYGSPRSGAGFAVGAACVFGIGLVASARSVTLGMPVLWLALFARLVGVLVIALPLIATRRIRLTRAAAPFVVVAGLCEVVGTSVYTIGAQHGIAVAAVMASQFATIATIAAYLLFGERLGRFQIMGVGLVVVGVAILTLMTA
jgi:drug/metabolite transporter (DMT)-like permease